MHSLLHRSYIDHRQLSMVDIRSQIVKTRIVNMRFICNG